MNSSPRLKQSIVVSFSGLDGSGKTTQITALREAAENLGLKTELITFWDDVVVGKRYRESFVHKVFKSEQGIGAPGRPVERRDKNVRAGYLTLIRHLLYLADAIHLRMVLARARSGEPRVIITDRYIYDELANLPVENRFSMFCAGIIARIASRPELAIMLDVDPEQARARKPEYSVTFMRQSRRSYYRLAQYLGTITVIPPLELQEARSAILRIFLRLLGHQSKSDHAGMAPAA